MTVANESCNNECRPILLVWTGLGCETHRWKDNVRAREKVSLRAEFK